MSKRTFYKRVYCEMDMEEFVKQYSEIYYTGGEKLDYNINQNSRYVEKQIEYLLEEGIKNEIDIIHVLAWKIGKINVKESEDKKKFVYTEDWKNAESFEVKCYNRKVDLTEFVNYVKNNIEELEKLAKDEPQKVLNLLKVHSPIGIGTVYLITMLYFISRGKYPIYDRFAMMAVDAIENGIEPEGYVSYKELPEKDNKKFKSVYELYNDNYVNKVKNIFGDEYNKRDVDRALWVYGHYFKDSKK